MDDWASHDQNENSEIKRFVHLSKLLFRQLFGNILISMCAKNGFCMPKITDFMATYTFIKLRPVSVKMKRQKVYWWLHQNFNEIHSKKYLCVIKIWGVMVIQTHFCGTLGSGKKWEKFLCNPISKAEKKSFKRLREVNILEKV